MMDLKGKYVCITGALTAMTRKEAHEQLEALGAIISKNVTKKTDILFCGERAGMKLEKAEELGIPIYREADFSTLVGDDAAIKRAAAKERSPAAESAADVLQEIEDGESVEVQGSAAKPYVLKNTGGVYSCSCPAWRNQSAPIDLRSCKHLAKIRGAAAETARVGRKVASVTPGKSKTPKVLLAQSWAPEVDPSGWWMSEKLDGVRALWTGETFVSRQGNPFFAPDWFVEDFPDTPLDGELWIGRGKFQKTVSVVRRQDKSELWRDVRYVIFDAPDHGGVFEERLAFMHEAYQDSLRYGEVLEHVVCRGEPHLQEELKRVEGLSGEGLMLRQARSEYVGSRSSTLLKVKTFYDAEAKVIGYKGGKGRHRNRVGALELITPKGVTFFAGTGLSDAERENPPEIGSLVTYRYQELTDAGVPRFPSYVGVRIDGEWTGPETAVVENRVVENGQKTKVAKTRRSPKKAPKKVSERVSEKSPGDTVPAPKQEATAIGIRRFVFGTETSGKFWEIVQNGRSHTVRYGKCGTEGRPKDKEFGDVAAAAKDVARLIRQKTNKGYNEV